MNQTTKFITVGSILIALVLAGFLITDGFTNFTGASIFGTEAGAGTNDDQVLTSDSILDQTSSGNNGPTTDESGDSVNSDEESNLGSNSPSGGGGSGGGPSSIPTSSDSPNVPEVVWEEVYSYSDEYSEGGFQIDTDSDEIEVSRAYVWKAEFGTLFNGRIQVVNSNDKYSWYGSRIALVDPSNTLVRYEIRLLPGSDKLEVRYVDRTKRTGTLSGIEPETISEQLTITNCNINTGSWYDVNIINSGNVWKVQLFSLTNPTCFVEWEDDKISAEKYGVGIQSAGKYVTSKFDTLIAE